MGVNKFGATASPVVPGRYFVFVERLVQEQYQTLVIEAEFRGTGARERA